MATYTNYKEYVWNNPTYVKLGQYTSSINIGGIDTTKVSCIANCYSSGYSTNTMTNCTKSATYTYSGISTVCLYTDFTSTESTFTCGAEGYGGCVFIPKEAEIINSENISGSSTKTIDTSNYDFTNYNYYLTIGANCSRTNLTYTGAGIRGYNFSGGLLGLYKIDDNTIPTITPTSSYPFILLYIRIPKQYELYEWPNLQVGDILNYNLSNYLTPKIILNMKGIKFGCRLKGANGSTRASSYYSSIVYGANCYAEFDFKSVNDGEILLGTNSGCYIALKNGSGTDFRYNRMMVAGSAGGGSPNSGTSGYYSASSAGLFGGSAGAGWCFDDSSNSVGGATQSSGGVANGSGWGNWTKTPGDFGSGGGGEGWYYGGSSSVTNGYYSYSGWGAGSSYLLTDSSYKPSGYFSEWTTYAPLISNGTSTLLTGDRDYYCTITILEVGGGSTRRTMKYYNGSTWVECNVNYYDGSEWIAVNPHYYDGSEWK